VPTGLPRSRSLFTIATWSCFAIALAASALVWPRVAPVSPDSCEYLVGGTSLVAGHGFLAHSGDVQTLFPPVYPALTGAVTLLFHDPIVAGRLVAVLASALTVFPLAWLTRRLFGAPTAAVTSVLYVLLPLRIQISTMVWSESVYLLLLVTAVWLWSIEAGEPRDRRTAGVGVLLGLAYLVRPEGLVSAAVLLGASALPVRGWPVVRWRSLAVCVVLLAAVVLPYVVFVHAHTGRWTLSSKAAFNRRVGIIRSYDRAWELANQLNADATAPSVAMITETPVEFARRYLHNVRVTADSAMRTFGPFLLVCAVLGSVVSLVRRDSQLWTALPSMAALGASLPLLPGLFIEDRYTFLATFPLLILGSWQLVLRFGHDRPPTPDSPSSPTPIALAGRAATLIAVAAVIVLSFVPETIAMLGRQGSPRGDQALGAWLDRHVATGEAIMSNNEPAVYYAGRRWIRLPYEGLARTLAHASFTHTTHIAISTRDFATSELHGLSTGAVTSDALERVADWDGGGARVVLFRIRPRAARAD
jgi:hypothetical protein